MDLGTKVQVAKTKQSLLMFVTWAFLLGDLVVVSCAGLQINSFHQTTTSFLVAGLWD